MALKESFEWAPPGIDAVPKANLLKLIAKTEATTYHPTDPNYPVRKFNAKELELAARTLIGRPVGRNHEAMPIYGAYVLDSEFSAAGNCVESIAYAPASWVDKVRKGLIKNCSIEYTWRDEKRNGGVEFEGLVFTRVDLLEGLKPGDKGSAVMLYEALDKETKTGALLTEVEVVESAVEKFKREKAAKGEAEPPEPPPAPALTDEEIAAICEHYGITREQYDAEPEKYPKPEEPPPAPPAAEKKLGEPFADYTNMDDCIAKNSDKGDPAAYCATIMRAVEARETMAEDGRPDKAWWDKCVVKAGSFADDPAKFCGWAWTNMPSMGEAGAESNELKTLQEAFQRVVSENNELKTKQNERINAAKTFAHEELKTAVEAVIPEGRFLKDPRINKLIRDVRGVLNEPVCSP